LQHHYSKTLAEEGIVKDNMVSDITNVKQIRMGTQHYVEKEDQISMKRNVENARSFVLELEES